MSLTNKTLANTYKDILQMGNSNNGIGTSQVVVKDGEGTNSALQLSDDVAIIKPQKDNSEATFLVSDNSANALLSVDSTNSKVSALGNYVNTQYANFSIGNTESAAFVDDTHHPIPFSSANYASISVGSLPAFGTGTDPATTFTTAEGNGTRASDIVPVI